MFNLDTERIQNTNTKKYLQEVISSLENGNYRSAIVMLYITIIFDLINKLVELKDFHQNSRATDILKKIQESNHGTNGQYESTENTLITEIMKPVGQEETESLSWLLNGSAANTVNTVKSFRNLCAHPSFDQGKLNKLIEPNKNLVTGLIRSCIDDIFSRPANFGKDVFSSFMDDLGDHKDYFSKLEEKDFSLYLKKTYFTKFNDDTYEYVVKNLFKEVFCRNGENEVDNLNINYRTLVLMITNKEELSYKAIEDSKYFDQMLKEDATAWPLSHLFQIFPNLYKKIPEYWKSYLFHFSKQHSEMNLENFFIDSDNILDHIKEQYETQEKYETDFVNIFTNTNNFTELNNLYLVYQSQGFSKDFLKLLTYAYSTSCNFDSADSNFKIFIQPFLNFYDKSLMESLITKANANGQCYSRIRAKKDHQIIFNAYNKLLNNPLSKEEFSEKYPNFLQ